MQVQILYVTLHPRLRNKPNTATSGAVVQLVRIRACHARGRGFEPLPHRQVPLMKMRGICRIWGFAVLPVHSRGQRKIPVDLHFIVRLRHKASGAALGPSCAVCFEQPAGVFAGCGAVCQAKIGSGGKPGSKTYTFVRKNRPPFPGQK